ncbi:MAG: LysR family transcriptional regulator [Chromatiaceae bacterium]|jgi:DNA-binding transcriptional LysR family regulator
MLDLNSLQLVQALAQSGSFTAAAERLGCTKTKISLQIKTLEQQLGVALFRRTTRQVSLTAAGEQMVAQCLPLFDQLQLELQQLQHPDTALSGKLVLTAPEDYANQILLPVLLEFSQQHPALQIELRSSDQVRDLVREGIDLAIRGGWLRDSSLKAHKLSDFNQWLLATPQYLAQHPPIKQPEHLSTHSLIAFNQLRTPLHWSMRKADQLAELQFHSRFTVSSTASIQALLLNHAGLGILTDYTAKPLIAAGQLVHVLPDWHLPVGGIYAVYPPGLHRPLKVRRFVELLQRQLQR